MLLLLPVWMKAGAQDVAVELQLPQAEPEDAAGLLMGSARGVQIIAAVGE